MAAGGGGRHLKLVTDANVWIDLDNGSVLTATFALAHEFVSPDVVVVELGDELGEMVRATGLVIVSQAVAADEQWVSLRRRYRYPSDADLHALRLAIAEDSGLLTGDRQLREAAEEHGLEVHGVLWVLDELVTAGLLGMAAAAVALRRMLADGARLPAAECERRLVRWGRT